MATEEFLIENNNLLVLNKKDNFTIIISKYPELKCSKIIEKKLEKNALYLGNLYSEMAISSYVKTGKRPNLEEIKQEYYDWKKRDPEMAIRLMAESHLKKDLFFANVPDDIWIYIASSFCIPFTALFFFSYSKNAKKLSRNNPTLFMFLTRYFEIHENYSLKEVAKLLDKKTEEELSVWLGFRKIDAELFRKIKYGNLKCSIQEMKEKILKKEKKMTNLNSVLSTKKTYKLVFSCRKNKYTYTSNNPLHEKNEANTVEQIYIVKKGNDILHVDKVILRIDTHINASLNVLNMQKSQSDYQKWIMDFLEEEITLIVYTFKNLLIKNLDILNTIACEIVLCHRNQKGKWPLYQREIHCFNDDTKEKKYINEAKRIYNEISKKNKIL